MILKAELHCHTYFSKDCGLKPGVIVKTCIKKGVNCLAITDHNEIRGAFEVQKLAPFKVIIGEEISTQEGEIIGFFLKEKIAPKLSCEETVKEIKKQGGLVAIPHPFDYLRTNVIKKEALSQIIDLVDMVEIFNSRNLFSISDKKALKYCLEKIKVPYIGSDCHTHFEIGRASLEIEDFKNPQEFLNNIKKAKLHTEKSPLWVHLFGEYFKF